MSEDTFNLCFPQLSVENNSIVHAYIFKFLRVNPDGTKIKANKMETIFIEKHDGTFLDSNYREISKEKAKSLWQKALNEQKNYDKDLLEITESN